jgi:catechol 2,3-dioxygenase-like lactoylglutathione lyase family enzyme
MSDARAILSLVTLGVADLERSIAFYEALGFERRARSADGVGFFRAGACAVAVFPSQDLARDADVAFAEMTGAFRGVALAWNCRSPREVDGVLERAASAGGTVTKPARKAFWGGYSGYFADPDGHLWEVAFNPHFPLSDDGRLLFPA